MQAERLVREQKLTVNPDTNPAAFLAAYSGTVPRRADVLAEVDRPVPYNTLLMWTYLGIFLFAEAAFTIMALREYLQDSLKISDQELLGATGSSEPQ